MAVEAVGIVTIESVARGIRGAVDTPPAVEYAASV